MNILAVDTSTQSCSVGIVSGQKLLVELTANTGQTHSRHILTMIDTVIGLSGLLRENMDAYAVTLGPGSFTGLRIGLSVVKGMAVVDNKPIIGVSSLDVLAFQCGEAFDNVCVLIDARRNEVYFSKYEKTNGKLKKTLEESVVSPQKALLEIENPCAFIGSGAIMYKKTIQEKMGQNAFFPALEDHVLRASSVAFLGLRQMENRQSPNHQNAVADILPVYIRASDAELNKKQKAKK